ncbi:MAG: calcium-binding protein [Pseudomonadota bacterium]
MIIVNDGRGGVVYGNDGDDTIYGGAMGDRLHGGDGDDRVFGDGGDDRLSGGAGADELGGRSGDDTASYFNSDAAVTVNLETGAASGGHAEGDTLTSIEWLMGSRGFGDTLTGDGGDNIIWGFGGDDVINGLGGDDIIYVGGGDDVANGGEGDDLFYGDLGADALRGDAGYDAVNYFKSGAAVRVNLETGAASGGFAEGDTLAGIEELRGSDAFGDALIGDAGDNTLYGFGGDDDLRGGDGRDRLYGGDDDDRLSGGGGADILNGGEGDDTVSYYRSDAAVAIDLSAGAASGGHAEGDTFAGIEGVIGSNRFGDDITGDANDNMLFGYGGGDVIVAGAGDDAIYVGSGDDVARGGDGDDRLYGDLGADVMDGGADHDTVNYYSSTAAVSVDLQSRTASGGYAEGDTLISIEEVRGSNLYGDVLVGDAGANTLLGFGGADTLEGGGGRDALNGGDGEDRLVGGADDDLLFGGGDADIFAFDAQSGEDTIRDFQIGVDKIDFTALGPGGAYSVSASGGDALVAFGAASVLLEGVDEADLSAGDFILIA